MNNQSVSFFYTMPLLVAACCFALFAAHGWYLGYRRRKSKIVGRPHGEGLRAALPSALNFAGTIAILLLLVGVALSNYA